MNQSILQTVPYAVAIGGAFLLFIAVLELRRRQQEVEQRWNKRQMLLQSELGKLRGVLEDLQTRLQDVERRSELNEGNSSQMAGINLNRRTQAIRLLRRGERPEQVSATLGMPPPEAELLLKVHRILSSRPSDA
jgi:uncharacterized protein YlxW (UPF0749 family)